MTLVPIHISYKNVIKALSPEVMTVTGDYYMLQRIRILTPVSIYQL